MGTFDIFRRETADFTDALRAALPAFEPAVDLFVATIGETFSLAGDCAQRSIHELTTHAGNDVLDLLRDAASFRGRPMLRSARSLFELRLGLIEAVTATDGHDRYVDHKHLTAMAYANDQIFVTMLRGNDRRAETHRRN